MRMIRRQFVVITYYSVSILFAAIFFSTPRPPCDHYYERYEQMARVLMHA